MPGPVRLTNICPVFPSDDVQKTAEFYTGMLGFRSARHFDKADNFATLYRDAIEIVVVQKRKGAVENNTARYGNGYDAYIDTDTVEGVDVLYEEFRRKGVRVRTAPHLTDYGSYEFTMEDIDGRILGFGLIKDDEKYFEQSNLRAPDR